MAKLAIFTASYEGDLELFHELHRSVLRYTADDVIHHVVVPSRDVKLFERTDSSRLRVVGTNDLLPRHYRSTYAPSRMMRKIPRVGRFVPPIEAINVRHPWPPVRGWILQQMVKLEAVAHIDAEVVVIADSDVVLIRPLFVDEFIRNGAVRFYRSANELTPDLVRHARWHQVSRRLLGLPPHDDTVDYISSFNSWDPAVVRSIQCRVEEVTGLQWIDAMSRELHFSEFMLYGCYVDQLGDGRLNSFAATDSRCRSHWSTTPLDERTAREFVESIEATDVAVLVQSKSHTPSEIRRWVIDTAQQRAAAG